MTRPGKRPTPVRELAVHRLVGESVFVPRRDNLAVTLDVKLLATAPANQSAEISVAASGGKADLLALGISPEVREYRLTADRTANIAPGVEASIGRIGDLGGVSATGARLVMGADWDLWDIVRDEALEMRLLQLVQAGKLRPLDPKP
jgi:hypothetical protein